MVNVFSHFSLPQISNLGRRTALSSVGVAVVALVVSTVVSRPLIGVGVALGVAMALVNFRLITRATVKATESANPDKRRPLVFNTLGRLGVISVIALGLVFLNAELGFGTLVGLALFQMALLLNVTVAMLHDPETTAGSGPKTGEP
jgi:ATP synthase I chain